VYSGLISNNVSSKHECFFSVAEINIQIQSDLPITEKTYAPKFSVFQGSHENNDLVSIHYHFSIPHITERKLGKEIYRSPPWAIYHDKNTWYYLGIKSETQISNYFQVSRFNYNHTLGDIFLPNEKLYLQGNLQSVSLFPTDQIFLARVLANLQGCYFHASGIIVNQQGLLFVGHSGAGKSTIAKMLMNDGELLCDDRIIVRRWQEGFKIHGTWSHGEIPIVSNASAPLRAILLLEQAPTNSLIPIENRGEIVRNLPFFIVKPLVTADWWEKTLDLVGAIARHVPVYRLQFDKSGRVKDLIHELVA